MSFSVGRKCGVVSDPNIVPLIDILLVLLVIFMVLPHSQGIRAQIPQECDARGRDACSVRDKPSILWYKFSRAGSSGLIGNLWTRIFWNGA